jgi:hypothetical protein
MDANQPLESLPSTGDLTSGRRQSAWGGDPSSIPDEAKPAESDFGLHEVATSIGLPKETLQGVKTWFDSRDSWTPEALKTKDDADRVQTETELRNLWGDNFGSNVEIIGRYLKTLPGQVGEMAHHLRGAGGRALLNDPAVLQTLLGAAKRRGNVELSDDPKAQIGAIQTLMRTNPRAYYADAALQARYRELLRTTK